MICNIATRKVSKTEFKGRFRSRQIFRLIGGLSGLYLLYNKYEELLYIGYASYLSERLASHLFSKTNTHYFQEEIDHFRLLGSKEIDNFRDKYSNCRDIEYYLIDKLNPKYNIVRNINTAYC
jgi:excinuclease UvrABC nuclease subunit